tara:strand:+ start:2229 stop:2363 length:135 start_codon:yes stop_codon:yes gene_type:complete
MNKDRKFQIRIEGDVIYKLRELAKQKKVSVAKLIRKSIKNTYDL